MYTWHSIINGIIRQMSTLVSAQSVGWEGEENREGRWW